MQQPAEPDAPNGALNPHETSHLSGTKLAPSAHESARTGRVYTTYKDGRAHQGGAPDLDDLSIGHRIEGSSGQWDWKTDLGSTPTGATG